LSQYAIIYLTNVLIKSPRILQTVAQLLITSDPQK